MSPWLRGLALTLAVLVSACATQAQREPVERNERAARINVQLGSRYLNQNNLDLASIKLGRAIRQDPDLVTAQWTYALLQSRLGETEVAERHFRKAIKLDPDDARARNNYGTFLCEHGEPQASLEQFEAAVANPLYKTPAQALANAGVCALKIPDRSQAEAYFRRALERDPESREALFHMARLSYQQERDMLTRAYLQRYAGVASHSAETLWLGLQAERRLGNRDAARTYALRLQRNFPESSQAMRLRESRTDGS